MLQLIKKCGQ